jgi:hypothetical protein
MQQRPKEDLVTPYIPKPHPDFNKLSLFRYQDVIDSCRVPASRNAIQQSQKDEILIAAIEQGDQKALYDLPILLMKEKNKKLTHSEQRRLKRYIEVITTQYKPKRHELIALNMEDFQTMGVNPGDGEIPGGFEIEMGAPTGELNMFCPWAKALQDRMLLTCFTSEEGNKIFAFIQDTALQQNNYILKKDRHEALQTRTKEIMSNGEAINRVFYSEYTDFNQKCVLSNNRR